MRSMAVKLTLAFLTVGIISGLFSAGIVGILVMVGFHEYVSPPATESGAPDGHLEAHDFVSWISSLSDLDPAQANFGDHVRDAFLAAIGVAVVLALVAGIILARNFSKPVSELTQATDLIAQGELGAEVPVHSRDELGRLATSFNRMSADLAAAKQQQQQMTADIAHDLRSPLGIIGGYAEALDEGKLQGSPEIYRTMNEQVQHLQHLVDDLRTLSLADAGALSLKRREVEPSALLERVALAYLPRAEAQGITLRLEATDDLPLLSVDVERMAQVLYNLVNNALRHTPPGGEVVLAAEYRADEDRHGAGGQHLLTVRDTGDGIPAEDLPYIFRRFYRADQARQRDNGESGLGLAIAKSIVEGHGGTISVQSELGQGTAFTIVLWSTKVCGPLESTPRRARARHGRGTI